MEQKPLNSIQSYLMHYLFFFQKCFGTKISKGNPIIFSYFLPKILGQKISKGNPILISSLSSKTVGNLILISCLSFKNQSRPLKSQWLPCYCLKNNLNSIKQELSDRFRKEHWFLSFEKLWPLEIGSPLEIFCPNIFGRKA